MRRISLLTPLVLVLLIVASTGTASAQGSAGTSGIGWEGWGVRAGISADPDQVFGGVHFNLGNFARNVRFRTTAEIGFGDDVTTINALAEVHYVFSNVQVWTPYVGGGVGLSYINFDNPGGGDDSDTELDFAAMGGVETKLKSGNSFGFEGKIGFGDNDADFKVGVTWGF